MDRAYYSDTIINFLNSSNNEILGKLTSRSEFSIEKNQIEAWEEEINILKTVLDKKNFSGKIYFEFKIPRMGKRIDVLLNINSMIFVLEFKVGEKYYAGHALDQVYDYALDLKNFHETSHLLQIFPVLIATNAKEDFFLISFTAHDDKVSLPLKANKANISQVFDKAMQISEMRYLDINEWEKGRYQPTPTIVEAATALYNGHTVDEITRSDAANLTDTTDTISDIIKTSQQNDEKSIIFLTGVPGAGKTLVGLNIATEHSNKDEELYSVFLSGNGPLVKVLCEALVRDKYFKDREKGIKSKKCEIAKEVKQRIQNVHHFRDECLLDESPPVEHVALFDEAQRAWNLNQTSSFMKRKKGKSNFNLSEPEFLISCMDRHKDWATIVCLVGGGQEINTGEAGIAEWLAAIQKRFNYWKIYISPNLIDSEYLVQDALKQMDNYYIKYLEHLHLAVSVRSFRSEKLSLLVKQILDFDLDGARKNCSELIENYPIILTRDINKAKKWLKAKARGSERYGVVVSSQAERLKPFAINIKATIDPIHWFLDSKNDVRSSYYLEDVATEFHVQGLELDWACVTWDADFRYNNNVWDNWSFKGSKWQRINKEERKLYQKNAYRVLLTRARQGMVIVVPEGSSEDHTRKSEFYDSTYQYLKSIGFDEIQTYPAAFLFCKMICHKKDLPAFQSFNGIKIMPIELIIKKTYF